MKDKLEIKDRIKKRGQSWTRTTSPRQSSPLAGARGQSLVEFGLMAPIYGLLLFGSIQLLYMPYQRAMMEKAVWAATRAAVTSTTKDESQIEEKMAKVVERYKTYGYFGNDMTVGLTEGSKAEQVTLTVPHRLFFNLGVKLGGSEMMDVRGGSLENYKGPLPERGGGT